MHYYIKLNLYKTNLLSILREFNESKSTNDFFVTKRIDIDKKEVHELTDFRHTQIGTIINFIYERNTSSLTKIKEKNKQNEIKIKKLVL